MWKGQGRNAIRRGSLRLLQWSLCVTLATGAMAAPPLILDPSGRAETPAVATTEDNPYLVRLATRAFVPRSRADVAAFRDEKVFVQFQRTLTAEEQAQLEAAGVVFHESLEPFTYLVSMPREAADRVQRDPLFLGAEGIQPTDKVTAAILKGEVPENARRPEGQVAVFFRFYQNVTLEEALTTLDRAGVTVSDRSGFLFGSRLEAVAPLDRILAACESSAVRAAFEVPPPPVIYNQQAAGISNVPTVNAAPYNLSGSSVAVGIWDGGQVRTTHQDLFGRVTNREIAQPIHDHSTHVAGTILGTGSGNAPAKGMASAATAFAFDFNGDPPTEQANSCRLPPSGDGIALSNHSWGINSGWQPICQTGVCTMHNDPNCFYFDFGETGFGNYDGTSQTWDDLVRKRGLTVVKSAGNDGNSVNCGPADCAAPRNPADCDGTPGSDGFRYDTIEQIGSAKNLITVGALNDDGATKTDFSSCGPTNDGRIKPDVVANGLNLLSTGGQADNDYQTKSGTSMSGPVVSGVVALVDQAWKSLHPARSSALNKPSPELVKALLINTATDLGRPGPDYAYGHGLVKANEAVDQMQAPNAPGGVNQAPNKVRTAFASEGETLNFRVSTPAGAPTGLIKTTLAWSDLPGSSASVVRYCNFVNAKIACTSNADCTPFHPLGACDAAPCGAVPCNLKNDLDGLMWNIGQSAVMAMPFIPPGVGAITNNANVYRNGVDNVEVIQTSDANGGDLPFTVFGYTVTGGQQRFTLASNKKLIFLPGNDQFANARALPAMVAADPAATDCPSGQIPCPAMLYPHNTWDSVNFDATLEAGETTSQPSVPQAHSVWFNWVAPSNGQATFDTAGADFDTTVEVWTGGSLATLTSVAFSDDVYGRQSRASFNAVAGTTYRIQVRGYAQIPPLQDVSMGVFPLNYYLIVCGNGTTEAGEQCDDGNSTNGDCCSSTCQLATGGSACTVGGNQCQPGTCSGSTCVAGAPLVCNDSNVCTNDSCNPASGCVFANNTVACDDGNACTTSDTCGGGTCHGGAPPAVPASTPNLTSTSAVHLSWSALAGATGYDVVRGSLGTLRSSGGNFTTATETCLADNQAPTGFDDPGTPAPGTGYFYLVRGTSCSGSGTYNTTSPRQVGSRDAEINAAPITCSAACSRGRCTTGSPMASSCDSCVAAICATDPFCCETAWDATCVEEVRTVCNSLTCPESAGACAHTVCTDSVALVSGCDNPPVNPSCVAAICANDPFCCNTEWDGICVDEVVTYCGKNCN